MRLLEEKNNGWHTLMWFCPGCDSHHVFFVGKPKDAAPHPIWSWNGDLAKPTFSPSLLNTTGDKRCHLFLKDGNIEYLSDCTHQLAGKTIPMEELP